MNYRPEIDGLRALAVLPVIFFHAGFQIFSGGFVGVDVFFVISGYLITTIILAEKKAGTFTIINFYERRARRILPALFVVMAVSLPFAWVWMLPSDLKLFSKSLIAVSAYSSNILFWLESGYFDSANELKPLLHTWSLAVEEQYYLFFPVFLILTWRLGKQWIVVILALMAILSLALAQWGSLNKPDATYFLLPTRGWELLIGALIAFYFSQNNLFDVERKQSLLIQQLGGALGLLLIGYAVFVFDSTTPFPGLYALIPTMGAAFVILFANDKTLAGKLLSNGMIVNIGLISYSAYLWHQPLFAFARQMSINELHTSILSFLILITFVLAYFSWKYVETPFRNKKQFSRNNIFAIGIIGTFVFMMLGLLGQYDNGFVSRSSALTRIASLKTVEVSYCHTSGRRSAAQIASGDLCTLGSSNVPTFAVIGDSHAGAIFESIKAYQTKNPFAFYAVSGSFCAPLLNGFSLDRYASKDCVKTTREAFKQIAMSDSVKNVILVGEWASYTKGYRDNGSAIKIPMALAFDDDGAAQSEVDNKHVFERSLFKTIHYLKSAGKNVIVVKSVPEFKQQVIPTISKLIWHGKSNEDIALLAPYIEVGEYNKRNFEVLEVFDKLQNVYFIETKNVYCGSEKCESISSDGSVLFSDTNHLTEVGAKPLAKVIMTQLGL
jgi:peptidoglycan/LPS O-acetylase OafA/YrhL